MGNLQYFTIFARKSFWPIEKFAELRVISITSTLIIKIKENNIYNQKTFKLIQRDFFKL